MIKQMNILEIANSFLKYFVKGIEDMKRKCKYTSTELAVTKAKQLPARQLEISNSNLYIPNASIISIGKIIDQIKVNKSPGYERLRMKDLKFVKDGKQTEGIVKKLTTLINFSLKEGCFLDILKTSIVMVGL